MAKHGGHGSFGLGPIALTTALMFCSAGGVLAQSASSSAAGDASASASAAGASAAGNQADGHQIYMSAGCAGCHQPNGGGGMGPKLAGDAKLSDADFVIKRILNGGGNMPAFKDKLSPDEIAAVATYVRTNFGNSFGEVTPEQVTQVAAGGSGSAASSASSAPQ